MNRFEELVSGYLEGTLEQKEVEILAQMIHDDQGLQERFIELTQMEGILYSKYIRECDRDALIERIQDCLKSGISRKIAGGDILEKIRHKTKSTRRIFTRPVRLAFAACFVIIAGAYIFNLYQVSRTSGLIRAEFIKIKGNVIIEREGRNIDVKEEMNLFVGDRIRTGKGGAARVEYKDEKTVISISSETEVRLEQKRDAKRVFLGKGAVYCDVARQVEDSLMRVITPHCTAEVIGTKFEVTADLGKSIVRVEEGRIRVESRDAKTEKISIAECHTLQQLIIEKGNISKPQSVLLTSIAPWRGLSEPVIPGTLLFEDDFETDSGKWIQAQGDWKRVPCKGRDGGIDYMTYLNGTSSCLVLNHLFDKPVLLFDISFTNGLPGGVTFICSENAKKLFSGGSNISLNECLKHPDVEVNSALKMLVEQIGGYKEPPMTVINLRWRILSVGKLVFYFVSTRSGKHFTCSGIRRFSYVPEHFGLLCEGTGEFRLHSIRITSFEKVPSLEYISRPKGRE